MYKLMNLLDNENVNVVEENKEKGYTIIEFKKDSSILTPSEAVYKYYMAKMNLRVRTALLSTAGGKQWTLSAGGMKMMFGGVKAKTDIKGAGDLFKKTLKSKVTEETVVKPVYYGNEEGAILLENTLKHIIALNPAEWGGKIILNDSLYLASCGLDISAERIKSMSGMVLGGEGLFNTSVRGNGTVLIESDVPLSELMVVELNGDTVKIDGNNALCWSGDLMFTVERTTKSLIGSAASGEGLVNVYSGTGKVLVRVV